ncbi:MAG TPA: cytochrome c oxidase subunit 4 [Marmoricola sp.]|nr:cytochrome c oxidase subunit 4 [Marmoricola sp.]
MRLLSQIFLWLGVFLILAGIGYGLHSGDYDGLTLMVTTAGCALLVGAYMVRSFHAGDVEVGADDASLPVAHGEPHVGPTIWPLVLSLSMIGLVIGAVTSAWVLLAGGVLLVVSGVGWLFDVHDQWLHHYRPSGETSAAVLSHVERKR